jgi:uncharacterized protein (DUF1810 family)
MNYGNNINHMDAGTNLQRFIDAQHNSYEQALSEIRSGKKRTHWMWFIFPQIQGLGFSEMSIHYAIRNLQEADAFLHHPVLGSRLVNICRALLDQPDHSAHHIFGSPDDQKLKSSMTLFSSIPKASPVFQSVLDRFFNGMKDDKTSAILEEQKG